MAKLAMAVEVISSIKDGAYKQARASDSVIGIARFVMSQCPSFPDDVPTEIKDQLYAGYQLRYNEVNPPVEYAVVNDHYIKATDEHKGYEKIKIGVDFVYSYSQQQIGKLKNENPYLYDIVAPMRKKIGTYCSNRLGDLKMQAKRIANEGKPRERSATKDFAERVIDVLDDLKAKCKTAEARGDTSANAKKLKSAIDAFNVAWSK